jgi:tetratricopeptide (TPR) repeat protein
VELARAFDQLAARHLSADDLGLWQTLALQVTECRYFLASLYWRSERTADAITTLVHVIDAPGMPEHSLARLLLVRAYGQLGAWERAQPHLERLAALTDFQDPAARRALERLRKATAQPKSSDLSSARADLHTVVTAIEQAFLASPAAYRALTLGRHLHDPLAYLELAHLCEEEDTPEELRATLQEGIRARGNFFPVAWLALGAEEEAQAAELEAAGKAAEARQACQRAAEAFATAFEQLQQLDFQPVRDFDPERLTTLRRKLAQRQEQP